MREIRRQRFDLTNWESWHRPKVRSICWDGDDLVDWVAGGHRFHPDGSITRRNVSYAYPFDRAVISPSGRYAVIYADRQTKGLVLHDGDVSREINRSFYHADVYNYPIALGRLSDGREVIVHCPERYNVLAIEELESGSVLTERHSTQQARDIFHSRLQISSDGRHLMSAGWVWHPVDALVLFDLDAAIRDPSQLDRFGVFDSWDFADGDVESAAFEGNDLVVVFMNPNGESWELHGEGRSQLGELGRWSLREKRWISRTRLDEHLGRLMPVGDFVVSFFEHPKLVDTRTGEVVFRWSDLASGNERTSIWLGGEEKNTRPPLAVDPMNARFALADNTGITVVHLG